MRFIFHIGWPKTGTTTIQKFSNRNRPLLREAGVCYPEFALTNGAHHSLAPHLFGCPDYGMVKVKLAPEAIYQSLIREAEETGAHTVLLSSELFSHAQRFDSPLLEPFHSHEIVITAFFRRQDYWINSALNQRLKFGDLPATLKDVEARAHYLDLLSPWANAFGNDSIRIFPLRRGDDSLKRLLDFIDVKAPSPVSGTNVSLSFLSLMFLHTMITRHQLSRSEALKLIDRLNAIDAANPQKPTFLFEREARLAMLDRHTMANNRLFETFTVDRQSTSFDEGLDDLDLYDYRIPESYTDAEFQATYNAVFVTDVDKDIGEQKAEKISNVFLPRFLVRNAKALSDLIKKS